MSQQINLYRAAYLKQREWLGLTTVVALALGLLLLVGIAAGVARMQASRLEAETAVLAPQLKALQEQAQALSRSLASAQPDAQLEAKLAATREQLAVSRQVVAVLDKGLGADTTNFAEYLRGFARQTPKGVWLTRVVIRAGGDDMEIHGRLLDAALLPDYIRRLNGEPAFRGRSFAALQLEEGKLENSAVTGAEKSAAETQAAAPFLEFTLLPERRPDAAEGQAVGEPKP